MLFYCAVKENILTQIKCRGRWFTILNMVGDRWFEDEDDLSSILISGVKMQKWN